MKPTIEQLAVEDVTFIKSLLKRSLKLYLTKSGKIRSKLNSKDLYQRNILEICLRLHSTINTLTQSRLFLEEHKNIIDNSKLTINNGEFIRYHIECFFIRVTTYKDLIFKLINKTYDFEIDENIGLERKIRKQAKKLNKPEINELLKGLDIIMDKIAPIRNEIAHGEYYNNTDLILIESSYFAKRTEDKEYKESLKRILFNSSTSMYGIELMMSSYLKLVYKKLLPIRREIEKQKLQATKVHKQSE